jgi:hypothetical protein
LTGIIAEQPQELGQTGGDLRALLKEPVWVLPVRQQAVTGFPNRLDRLQVGITDPVTERRHQAPSPLLALIISELTPGHAGIGGAFVADHPARPGSR